MLQACMQTTSALCFSCVHLRGSNTTLAPTDITDSDTVLLDTLRVLSITGAVQPNNITYAGKPAAGRWLVACSMHLDGLMRHSIQKGCSQASWIARQRQLPAYAILQRQHIFRILLPPPPTAAGARVNYTYVITNPGNVMVRNVAIAANGAGPLTCNGTTNGYPNMTVYQQVVCRCGHATA